jgi:hypothetical protein
MIWEAFCKWTDTTAIYPEAGTGSVVELSYIAMGLAGEYGEAIGKAADDEAEDEAFVKELEDALWYVARGYRALEALSIDPYAVIAAPFEKGVSLRICNVTKKLLRDGVDQKKIDELATMYPQALAEVIDILHPNRGGGTHLIKSDLNNLVEKLESRRNRGCLGGSGDNR